MTYKTLTVAAVTAALALGIGPAQQRAMAEERPEPSPRISVTGTGRVSAKPDEATLTLGVTSEDRSLKKCFELQTAAMNRVIGEIKKAGAAPDDIRTAGYTVTPKAKNAPTWWGGPKPESYEVSHLATVKVRDLSKVGELIDRVVASGANQIQGLQFGSSRIAALEREAKVKAVEDARGRAEAMAQGAGVKLGRILEIHDSSGPRPVYQPQMRTVAMMAESAPPQIEPGSIDVESSCSLVIELVQ